MVMAVAGQTEASWFQESWETLLVLALVIKLHTFSDSCHRRHISGRAPTLQKWFSDPSITLASPETTVMRRKMREIEDFPVHESCHEVQGCSLERIRGDPPQYTDRFCYHLSLRVLTRFQ